MFLFFFDVFFPWVSYELLFSIFMGLAMGRCWKKVGDDRILVLDFLSKGFGILGLKPTSCLSLSCLWALSNVDLASGISGQLL